MSLREASCEDADVIAALESWTADQVRASLALPTTRGFVVDDVGHVLASSAGGEGEVLIISVRPERRRQGWGQQLLRACHAWWREEGVDSAFLEVRVDNAAAQRLYLGAGWTEAGRRPRYYRDGSDALLLRWSP